MTGAIAFKKLEKLAQPANLENVIKKLNFGATETYDPRSCAMNNLAVIKTLTNQAIPATAMASQLSGLKMLSVPNGQTGVHTESVMKLLGNSAIVSFSVKFTQDSKGRGDHYFSAFQLDEQNIVAAMGWQGVYDLSDYFNHNHNGRFAKSKFDSIVRQIEDGDIEGIYRVCSFLGETKEGRKIPEAIINEVKGTRPKFENTYYFDLPAS